ncbi:hypothetical protein GLS40_07105 [Pseudooceanicola sp. 216_PA32_1]|uniref:Transferrin-binding protein B C-lobe/N-lobe beta-barrel domain-containing protein n=1 Tax=Pseudooceanicola pacificus TaxID=2676438 RepID=A0A844W121_9RHOB|nr:transferrin-binding protein-like solute binding protein [Pseudooceanicola pacificus]MWB77786.1 hypothetical protein [Pseudooceanicola pacificus]
MAWARIAALWLTALCLAGCDLGVPTGAAPHPLAPPHPPAPPVGADPSAFTGFATLPSTGAVVLQGQGIAAPYVLDANGAVTVAAIPPSGAARLILDRGGGQTRAMTLETGGLRSVIDTRNGGQMLRQGGMVRAADASGTSLALLADEGANGYGYQTHGVWVTGYGTGSGQVAVASVGALSPADAARAVLPLGGTASYAGQSTGVARDGAGTPYFTRSTVTVSTDFRSLGLTSSGTLATNANSLAEAPMPQLDFVASAQVAGSGFSGTVAGAGMTGALNGAFYGGMAEELGGVFSASGAGMAYAGAFGARR